MYSQAITNLILKRFSCRSYLKQPIAAEQQERLRAFLATHPGGPFNSAPRFDLAAASPTDSQALRGLGTYGFIKNPGGFIIGTVEESAQNLEDFGYVMEQAVLLATDLGLGTCWLGGSFTKSSFAKRIAARGEERVPAVTAVGYIASGQSDWIRIQAGSDKRYGWEHLFFDQQFGIPLTRQAAGMYAAMLDMVRMGPSASNKQPWRVIKAADRWHFYMQRTPGYRHNLAAKVVGVDDMQRLDMGIAMCHFELTARELRLEGRWVLDDPGLKKPDEITEYTVTWVKA